MAVRSARMAEKWKGFERTKRLYPNLEFIESTAVNKRPEHLQWVGTVLPIDHPWWNTHTPPVGWGCECSIRNTDKPVTTAPGYEEPVPPVFANNPGKTAEFINMKEHPMVKGVCKNFAGCKTRLNLADKYRYPQCAICVLAKEYYKNWDLIKTKKGIVRVSYLHGKTERAENVEIASFFANKYEHEIDLLPRVDGKKTADVLNKTLGYEQEYKRNYKATISAIDNQLRYGAKQAEHIVIDIKSKIKTGDLIRAIRDRVQREPNIQSVWVKIGKFDKQYTRDEIISKGFKIQRD